MVTSFQADVMILLAQEAYRLFSFTFWDDEIRPGAATFDSHHSWFIESISNVSSAKHTVSAFYVVTSVSIVLIAAFTEYECRVIP